MMLDELPDDLLFLVFHHLDAYEILALRQVCLRLRDVTLLRAAWTEAYKQCPYPTSRAGADHQILLDDRLEAAVTDTMRRQQRWTSDSNCLSNKRRLPVGPGHMTDLQLVEGRWLVVHYCLRGQCEVAVHDLDAPLSASVAPLAAFQTKENTFLGAVQSTWLQDTQELVIAWTSWPACENLINIHKLSPHDSVPTWKVSAEQLPIVPMTLQHNGNWLMVLGGFNAFALLDLKSLRMYAPVDVREPDPAVPTLPVSRTCLTTRHVILFQPIVTSPLRSRVEVYTLPESNTHTLEVTRSYDGMCPFDIVHATMLREITDPTTGRVYITLAALRTSPSFHGHLDKPTTEACILQLDLLPSHDTGSQRTGTGTIVVHPPLPQMDGTPTRELDLVRFTATPFPLTQGIVHTRALGVSSGDVMTYAITFVPPSPSAAVIEGEGDSLPGQDTETITTSSSRGHVEFKSKVIASFDQWERRPIAAFDGVLARVCMLSEDKKHIHMLE